MRAFCNDVKASLLGRLHNPEQAQAEEVTAHPDAPVKETSSWDNWWNVSTKRILSKHQHACNRIAPGAMQWIQFPYTGSPVQRHFAALDAMLELNTEQRSNLIQGCLNAIHRTWRLFSSIEPLSDGTTAASIKALTGSPNGIKPTLKWADDRAMSLVKLGLVNPFHYNIPTTTAEIYSESTPEAALNYLWGLLEYEHELPAACAISLAFEIATCIALLHADNQTSGAASRKAFFYGIALWDQQSDACNRLERTLRDDVLAKLMGVRDRYHTELARIGISFDDIHKLVAPIRVLCDEKTQVEKCLPAANMGGHQLLRTNTNQVMFIDMNKLQIFAPDKNGKVIPEAFEKPTTDVDAMASIAQAKRNALLR